MRSCAVVAGVVLAGIASSSACAQWRPLAIKRILEVDSVDRDETPVVQRVGDVWLFGGRIWTPSSSAPTDVGTETDVGLRIREARERTHRHWLEQRLRNRFPVDVGMDGGTMDWLDALRRPDPLKWPWWLW